MSSIPRPPPPTHPITVKYTHTHIAHVDGRLDPQPTLSVVLENVPPFKNNRGHDWKTAAYTLGAQLLRMQDEVDAANERVGEARRNLRAAVEDRDNWYANAARIQNDWDDFYARVGQFFTLTSWPLRFLLPRAVKVLL